MKKRIQTVINQTIKQSLVDSYLFTLKCIGVIVLMLILAKNISASQAIDSLYFRIFSPVMVDSQSVRLSMVEFLRKIRTLPEFSFFFSMSKNMYGHTLENEIYKDERKRVLRIAELEAILTRNPKARDVLYELSVLYGIQGNSEKSEEYLRRTREVDPMVGR
jgi:hypothetical protein